MTPPVYNASRLVERPFPDVSQPILPIAEVFVDGSFVGNMAIEPNAQQDNNSSAGNALTNFVDGPLEQIAAIEPNGAMAMDDDPTADNAIDQSAQIPAIGPNAINQLANSFASNAMEEAHGRNAPNDAMNFVDIDPFADDAVDGSARDPPIEWNDNTATNMNPFVALPDNGYNDTDPLEVKPQIVDEIYNSDIDFGNIETIGRFNVTEFDDGLKMYYEGDASFIPKTEACQVKCNDPFSGNIPFTIDVSHAFAISTYIQDYVS